MTPLYSRDLYFVHENLEMFSIYCVTHSIFLLCFHSSIFAESVLFRDRWLDTATLLESGALLLLISSFHFRDKRWELLKHMKTQLLAKWEFPKTLTYTILLVSSVFICLSPWERLSQMPWKVVSVEACTPASGTQWLIALEPAAISSTWAIHLHHFQWHVRKKDPDLHTKLSCWAELLEQHLVQKSLHAQSMPYHSSILQGFSKPSCMLNACNVTQITGFWCPPWRGWVGRGEHSPASMRLLHLCAFASLVGTYDIGNARSNILLHSSSRFNAL